MTLSFLSITNNVLRNGILIGCLPRIPFPLAWFPFSTLTWLNRYRQLVVRWAFIGSEEPGGGGGQGRWQNRLVAKKKLQMPRLKEIPIVFILAIGEGGDRRWIKGRGSLAKVQSWRATNETPPPPPTIQTSPNIHSNRKTWKNQPFCYFIYTRIRSTEFLIFSEWKKKGHNFIPGSNLFDFRQ